jgi:competence protein ComEA
VRDRPRLELVAYAVGALVLIVVGARLLLPEEVEPAGGPPRLTLDGAAAAAGAPAEVGEQGRRGVYVHVAGAVRRPGIYRVPAGARVSAAVKRARGPTRRAELTAVNLAAPLRDGQQVVVPARGAVPPGGVAGAAGSGGGAPGAGQRLSLSQATPEQLEELDGIGPALAERIVEHRTARGGFGSIDELREVEGIGPKRFEALRGAVDP